MAKSRKTTRDIISEIVADLPKGVHLSAQELKDRMEEEGRSVSLSTVYRALERLNDEGTVRSIMSLRGQLWEVSDDDEQHDHLICTRCGMTIEFSDMLVSGFGKTLAERKGYQFQESRFDIYGFCSACKNKTDQITAAALQEIHAELLELACEIHEILEKNLEKLSRGQSDNLKEELALVRAALNKSIEKCREGEDLL